MTNSDEQDREEPKEQLPPEFSEETDRRRGSDRRGDGDTDRRSGWDRRRGPGRRRADTRKAAEEGEMDDEQFEFIMAIDEYKRVNKRPFPTFTEVLEIAKAMGYRKVAEPQPLAPRREEDMI